MGRRTQFARRRDRGRIRSIEVDVIVTYATSPILAAKHATSVIPIVFAAATDAVAAGLVASLARPGGNVTGPQRAPDWAPFPPTETDCMAEDAVHSEPVSLLTGKSTGNFAKIGYSLGF